MSPSRADTLRYLKTIHSVVKDLPPEATFDMTDWRTCALGHALRAQPLFAKEVELAIGADGCLMGDCLASLGLDLWYLFMHAISREQVLQRLEEVIKRYQLQLPRNPITWSQILEEAKV